METAKKVLLDTRVAEALGWLKRHGSKKVRDDMAPRYGIHAEKAFGVPMRDMKRLGAVLGRDHELALALWETGWYEARIVTSFVGDPAQVTPAQMERWCLDFDNWAVCDTLCFNLFDRSPHAWKMVKRWSKRAGEFEKRAGFALLACLAAHDRTAQDEQFAQCLPLVVRAAEDERNFVKKSVSWALRSMGRRSAALHKACVDLAQRLAKAHAAAPRWVGKDALRDLTRPAVIRKVRLR